MTEKVWQAQVVQLATLYGWRVYHTYDSRRSEPGFPDLTLVRVPELIMAELKTERGRLTQAQKEWIASLAACGVEVAIWRPSDFDVVHDRLRRRNAASERAADGGVGAGVGRAGGAFSLGA